MSLVIRNMPAHTAWVEYQRAIKALETRLAQEGLRRYTYGWDTKLTEIAPPTEGELWSCNEDLAAYLHEIVELYIPEEGLRGPDKARLVLRLQALRALGVKAPPGNVYSIYRLLGGEGPPAQNLKLRLTELINFLERNEEVY